MNVAVKMLSIGLWAERDFDKKGMKGVFVSLRDGHKSNSRWTLDTGQDSKSRSYTFKSQLTHSLTSKPVQILELIARTFFPAMLWSLNQVTLCKL